MDIVTDGIEIGITTIGSEIFEIVVYAISITIEIEIVGDTIIIGVTHSFDRIGDEISITVVLTIRELITP